MILGIDLGTTNSAAAYINSNGIAEIIPNRDGQRTTPSVILFEDSNPIVGESAKDNAVLSPLNVVQFVKRNMGNASYRFDAEDGKEYRSEELSAMILKYIKEDAESFLGEKVEQAVITVPAYFDDAQRQATMDAGKIAGLDVLAIINETTAAALAYGMNQSEHQTIMVYDLGGGTFDVTIMELDQNRIQIKATSGDRNLGGFDVDNIIIMYVLNQMEENYGVDCSEDDTCIQDLRLKVENLKKTLSSREKAALTIFAAGKPVKIELTRAQFEEMIEQKFLSRTIDIMEMAIEDAGLNWNQLDKVLLVGGSTRIPAVQRIIREVTGILPSAEINPDEAVALGAAYYGANLGTQGSLGKRSGQKDIVDVNSHSLGIVTYDEDKMMNSIILQRNQPIPTTAERTFYTASEQQTELLIQVTEGEDEDVDYVKIIGTAQLKIHPHAAGAEIRIRIQYDSNGLIHVSVYDVESNEDLGEMKIARASNLREDTLEDSKRKMEEIEIK